MSKVESKVSSGPDDPKTIITIGGLFEQFTSCSTTALLKPFGSQRVIKDRNQNI